VQRGHCVVKNIVNYCISVLARTISYHRPWALLWLQQSSWSSSAVVIEIDASPTASLCLLCLRPLPRACLPRSAAFSQSNPFTCKQLLVPAMLLKRSCRAAQNDCQPAASLVSPAAARLFQPPSLPVLLLILQTQPLAIPFASAADVRPSISLLP
jgi:hypothetical protein